MPRFATCTRHEQTCPRQMTIVVSMLVGLFIANQAIAQPVRIDLLEATAEITGEYELVAGSTLTLVECARTQEIDYIGPLGIPFAPVSLGFNLICEGADVSDDDPQSLKRFDLTLGEGVSGDVESFELSATDSQVVRAPGRDQYAFASSSVAGSMRLVIAVRGFATGNHRIGGNSARTPVFFRGPLVEFGVEPFDITLPVTAFDGCCGANFGVRVGWRRGVCDDKIIAPNGSQISGFLYPGLYELVVPIERASANSTVGPDGTDRTLSQFFQGSITVVTDQLRARDVPRCVDLNADGQVDWQDLCLWIGDPSDTNNDLVVDASDLAWLRYLVDSQELPPARLLADLNGDDTLTPADFNAWILAFNQQLPQADQNGDQLVTPSDFNAWVLNYNRGSCEPTSL
ncbi:MAG: hypothetical protein AAFR76_03615 [Planctomycetota bacterium]